MIYTDEGNLLISQIFRAVSRRTSNTSYVNFSGVPYKGHGIPYSYGKYRHGVVFSAGIEDLINIEEILHTIFEVPVSAERYHTVLAELKNLLKGWDASTQTTWKDIPESALQYLRSLPEFNSVIFGKITGIYEEAK